MAVGRYVRLILVGRRFSGDFIGEEWQTGISMVDSDGGGVFAGAIREGLPSFNAVVAGQAETDATFDMEWAWHGSEKFTKLNQIGLANQAVTFFNAIKTGVPTDSRLEEIRIQARDSANKVINGANLFLLKTPVAGSAAAASQLPPQIAVVASLRTGARGPRGRGRMYLPLSGKVGSSGKIGSADRTTYANATATFIANIRSTGPRPAVVNPGPLTYSDVTTVQLGDMFDVQRRRREGIQETYVSVTP